MHLHGCRDYHSKWSKSKRERQIARDITYVWNLKYDINELVYVTEAESQTWGTDLWLPGGRGGRGQMGWEFGITTGKLLYIYRMEEWQGLNYIAQGAIVNILW